MPMFPGGLDPAILPPLLLALAALVSASATLVWSFRRRP